MPADNSRHLSASARRRHELARSKTIRTLRELERAGALVTFEAVARQASVSRAFLYTQPDLRAEIERLRDATRRAPAPAVPARQRASDASLLAPATRRQLTRAHARRGKRQAPRPARPRPRRPARNPTWTKPPSE